MSKYNVSCPSGFPEWTPAEERVYQQWVSVIRDVFEKNGFMPITTPLVEREENLLSKGGNPKEMYVLKRILDEEGDNSHSGNALRFDHTVPLALYVARHLNDIAFPFKRYAIGPVLRGERAQKGRFRQFDQCDIDVIGSGELSLANDAMVAAVIIQIFERLLEGEKFVVRINNRKILTGFFEQLKIKKKDIKNVLAIVDDLEKIGHEKVQKNLLEMGLSETVSKKILEFTEISGTNDEILKKAEKTGLLQKTGLNELKEVLQALRFLGVDEKKFKVDLSIARGLDYYTGTVYETTLVGSEGLGSICSGGRYDDLAEIFTGKKLPGVGISIGLTRLLSKLFEAKLVNVDRSSPSHFLVIAASEGAKSKCLKIASLIRSFGYPVENYLEDKKIGKQFEYADKLGIPYAVIVGDDELSKKCVQLKNMKSGTQKEIVAKDLEKELKKL
ncbi:histidine--tRNA ligase [Candidatus Gracilibacteria bacterium]|nr:histidine--tRNA ligase [Candidatus Gracilibacteria bacterium]